ncbi:hypothetical protein SCHPADRAFT_502271 [Schizopora paradoxa]|uniref:F-box domain-containing protein n=1 Tax=Schizopora paradoxa TaxID=27342 RepID=A0A0H2RFW2_9AGAM|nr:hypothetical protein SCHPADRAFT_502271 [Schizopora paradoxa]
MAVAQDLPEDILYPIFLHALPCEIPWPLTPSSLQSLPPFNFSLVCRSWRLVTLTRPRLWSSLSSSTIDRGHYPLINSLLEYWFLRGAAAPLDLYFGKIFRPTPEAPKDLLNLVLRETYRWNEIQMDVTPIPEDTTNSPLTFRCSTLIKSLKLLSGYVYDMANDLMFGRLDLTQCTVHVASQLQVLEVCAFIRWTLPESGTFWLPNLRYLNISIDRDIKVDVILAACPNISSLIIEIRPSASHGHMESVNLPHLTNFILSTENDAFTNSLLTRLSCTSLVRFVYNSWDWVFKLHILADFLSKLENPSGCSSLEELKIVHRGVNRIPLESQSEFALMLKNMLNPHGNLKQLLLNDVFINKEIIEILSPRSGAMHVCPSLTSIFIACHLPASGDLGFNETLEEFVVSRWHSRNGNLAIELRFNSFKNFSEESQRIRKCVEEGLVRELGITDFYLDLIDGIECRRLCMSDRSVR